MEEQVISQTDQRDALIDAALLHVPFDGWSDETLRRALADSGLDPAMGRVLFPRGPVDLALAFHMRGDRRLAEWIAANPFDGMGMTAKITAAIRHRIELVSAHREAVRRGSTLFALPIHAADGAKAIWHTADTIWTGLGDTSTDYNWYTKRATLSGVYSATVLYWLGDETAGHIATWDFLNRRIADVMRIEKAKAKMRANPLGRAFAAGPGRLLDLIKAPSSARPMPGSWNR